MPYQKGKNRQYLDKIWKLLVRAVLQSVSRMFSELHFLKKTNKNSNENKI